MIDSSKHREETARKIIMLRKSKGWSQSQIANRIKIPKSRYGSYEEARAVVPYLIIRDLCKAYGITLDEFENLLLIEKEQV